MLSFYELADDMADDLVWQVQEDWEVFADRLVDSGRAWPLLEAIMDTGWDDDSGEPPMREANFYRRRISRSFHTTMAEAWEEFRARVREDPQTEDPEFHVLFDEELSRIEIVFHRTRRLFRARLGYVEAKGGDQPYGGAEIGAEAGRANRLGEAVLYCADQEETAVAEVRPARGAYVSVCRLCPRRDLRIVDLTKVPPWPNPFTTETLNYEVELRGLLITLGKELSRPLRRSDDARDYVPSQKLARRLRHAGFDGIRYPSAMAPRGRNVVIFNPGHAKILRSRLVEVIDVRMEYRAL